MHTGDGYIVRQCLNGETEAFGLLVDRYKTSIYALVYAKVGNFADAEDLTQETFINAFERLGTLKCYDNFFAWLYSIALNRCKNFYRTRSRRRDRDYLEDQDPYLLLRRQDMAAHEWNQNNKFLRSVEMYDPAIDKQYNPSNPSTLQIRSDSYGDYLRCHLRIS